MVTRYEKLAHVRNHREESHAGQVLAPNVADGPHLPQHHAQKRVSVYGLSGLNVNALLVAQCSHGLGTDKAQKRSIFFSRPKKKLVAFTFDPLGEACERCFYPSREEVLNPVVFFAFDVSDVQAFLSPDGSWIALHRGLVTKLDPHVARFVGETLLVGLREIMVSAL